MNRIIWLTSCLTMLSLTVAACGQSTGSGSTAGSSLSDVVSTAQAGDSGVGDIIKQQLRQELAAVAADLIQAFFRDLRPAFGLPAVPTDVTADPLAAFESAILAMVNARLTP